MDRERKGSEGKGRRYLRSALSIALGAGAALGGAYIVSRVTEKQSGESRLGRLEGMLEKLGEGPAEKKKPAARPKPKAKPAK